MNAERLSDVLTERLAARVQPAVAKVAAELEADVKRRISVPVGYSGSRIIRSKPGEPPRRETGDYRSSWSHRTARGGERITASVGTVSNIGPMLEYGTSRMAARPHVGPAVRQFRAEVVNKIRSNL